MVDSRNEMLTILRRASSLPLRIASATSPALPSPSPTLPRLSPTTTSALKLKRRPPLTTLAERLMNTTFSFRSLPSLPSDPLSVESEGLPRRPPGPPWRPPPRRPGWKLVFSATMFSWFLELKLQSCFARRIGQRFYFSVKLGPTPVKDHSFDALASGCFGCQLPNSSRAGHIGFPFFAIWNTLAERRNSRQRPPSLVIDKLNVDILAGETDTHARTLARAGNLFANAPPTQLREVMFFISSHSLTIT